MSWLVLKIVRIYSKKVEKFQNDAQKRKELFLFYFVVEKKKVYVEKNNR